MVAAQGLGAAERRKASRLFQRGKTAETAARTLHSQVSTILLVIHFYQTRDFNIPSQHTLSTHPFNPSTPSKLPPTALGTIPFHRALLNPAEAVYVARSNPPSSPSPPPPWGLFQAQGITLLRGGYLAHGKRGHLSMKGDPSAPTRSCGKESFWKKRTTLIMGRLRAPCGIIRKSSRCCDPAASLLTRSWPR